MISNSIVLEEQKSKWEETKKNKEEDLRQKEKEQEQIIAGMKQNPDDKNNEKLKKQLKHKISEINSLKAEIQKNYSTFKPTQAGNELTHLKKGKQTTQAFKQFTIPRYALPETGILYEDKNHYYLQITDSEDLSVANEVASKRYIDKPCKVVAKGEKK